MDAVVEFLFSAKEFLAGQILLFVKSYFYFWLFFTFLEMIQPDEKRLPFSKHQANEIFFGLFIAICLWPLDAAISVDSVRNYLDGFVTIDREVFRVHSLPILIQVTIGLVFMDLSQYLRHRLMHTKPMWGFHATHHSAIELRSSTHFRVHPIDFILSRGFTLLMLFVVGMNVASLTWVITIITVNNLWLHANIDLDYGFPLRFVLSSPNYHKWHHATDADAQNKNYADIFPFLDLIGGTYYYPRDKKPSSYGVTGTSINAPIHQTFLGPFVYPFVKKPEAESHGSDEEVK